MYLKANYKFLNFRLVRDKKKGGSSNFLKLYDDHIAEQKCGEIRMPGREEAGYSLV